MTCSLHNHLQVTCPDHQMLAEPPTYPTYLPLEHVVIADVLIRSHQQPGRVRSSSSSPSTPAHPHRPSDVLFSFFSGSSCRLELRLGSCKGPTWNARRDQQLTVEGPRQLSGHQGPSRSEKEPSPTLIACCIGSSSPLFLAAMSDPAASSAGPSHKAHHASRSGQKAEKKDKAKGIDRSGGKGFNEKASPFHL